MLHKKSESHRKVNDDRNIGGYCGATNPQKWDTTVEQVVNTRGWGAVMLWSAVTLLGNLYEPSRGELSEVEGRGDELSHTGVPDPRTDENTVWTEKEK